MLKALILGDIKELSEDTLCLKDWINLRIGKTQNAKNSLKRKQRILNKIKHEFLAKIKIQFFPLKYLKKTGINNKN